MAGLLIGSEMYPVSSYICWPSSHASYTKRCWLHDMRIHADTSMAGFMLLYVLSGEAVSVVTLIQVHVHASHQ
jgi:hypothetical protein